MSEPLLDLSLIPDDGTVIAMVSGGSDSTALLFLLVDALGAGRVHVLHVNHCLRGADADADERFVADLCERLGVPYTVRRIDIAALAAAERGNVEAVGRRERYRCARELAAELGASCIATAHTRDDRVETFLMRASVGTGPGGLASIRPRTGDVIHPLLGCSRQELRDWLSARGEGWREDATNLVADHDRTYLRLEVLPALRAHYPAFDANLARTMDLVADEDDYLAEAADQLLSRTRAAVASARAEELGVGPDALLLDAPTIAAAPRVLARRAIRQALFEAAGPELRPDSKHIEWTVDGASRDGFATDFSQMLAVRNISQTLVFAPAAQSVDYEPLHSASVGLTLAIPGRVELASGRVVTASEVAPPAPSQLAELDPAREAIVDVGDARELSVGRVAHGERMVPLGFAKGSKKLADVLSDAKVPRALRAQLPVVRLAGDEPCVVWLAGVCVDERFRIGASTARAVRLTFE